MQIIIELCLIALILLGVFFSLVGSFGLLTLPDLYMRLHAPTKAGTLGLGCFIIAAEAYAFWLGHINFAVLLITLFVFITAPVSANLLAQAAIHLRLRALSGDVPESIERPLPWQSRQQMNAQEQQQNLTTTQPPKGDDLSL